MTHYDELRVVPDATAADLRRAYRAQAARLHPDKHAGIGAKELAAAERDMRSLNDAWSCPLRSWPPAPVRRDAAPVVNDRSR